MSDEPEPRKVMRAAIDAALEVTPFDPAAFLVYCAVVKASLNAALPGMLVDVFDRRGELVVEVRHGKIVETSALPLT